jgi:hypothetical protein
MEATPMRHANQGRFRQQVQFLRRQFLQDGDLPFTNVLSEEIVSQSLSAFKVFWKDRIYSPMVTLWVFLAQVLSADACCRAAVARLIAHRLSQGQKPCSAETGAYCQARKRLPEKFFSEVARQTGRELDDNIDPAGFTSMTDRRFRCPILRKTKPDTRNPSHRDPAWDFRWRGSRRSSRSRVARFWTWASAVTLARDKVS